MVLDDANRVVNTFMLGFHEKSDDRNDEAIFTLASVDMKIEKLS